MADNNSLKVCGIKPRDINPPIAGNLATNHRLPSSSDN